MKRPYQATVRACFTGYIVQAIVNNFAPLLFLTFSSHYQIPIAQITFLVTFNFGLQLLVDLLSAGLIHKIGYRKAAVTAHLFAAAGLALLTVLPEITGRPFAGILISVMIYAVGGGLLEVLVSPIVEACPAENKERQMSLLHSFYCWGHVAVVLFSTIFFSLFGIGNWKILCLIWMLIPAVNAIIFTKVPMPELYGEEIPGLSLRELVRNKIFWLMLLLMTCAGACEQAVSQWASVFAEQGLGVEKTVGDLAGPMLFASAMGLSRLLYGKFGGGLKAEKTMLFSGILCAATYLLIALSPDRMRRLRFCRRHPLARRLQHRGKNNSDRRHGHVCFSCAGRRPRLHGGAHAGRNGIRFFRKQLKAGLSHCSDFSGAADNNPDWYQTIHGKIISLFSKRTRRLFPQSSCSFFFSARRFSSISSAGKYFFTETGRPAAFIRQCDEFAVKTFVPVPL